MDNEINGHITVHWYAQVNESDGEDATKTTKGGGKAV